MALTAEQRFDLLVPQYAAHASKAGFLEMAEERTAPVSASGWTEAKRAQAVALRAAHSMTMRLSAAYKGGATAGAVTSKREGDLSVSYGAPAGNSSSGKQYDPDLVQTSFGRELISLIDGTFILVGTTGDEDYVSEF